MCDVCGRTLLRGEHADTYLNGLTRRLVCELCKSRALQEGWVREGTIPAGQAGTRAPERRRPLLWRLRARHQAPADQWAPDDALQERRDGEGGITLTPPGAGNGLPPRPVGDPAAARRRPARQAADPLAREPRHVRAVPTSTEQRASAAVEVFNRSEHPRTVAGVARSLGPPAVHVAPSSTHPSIVAIVVSWELCWYRYELDLSDADSGVRISAQGYELQELSAVERTANAVADADGALSVASVQ
jgi:hypothetical protein